MNATIIALSKLLAKNLPELAAGESVTVNETVTLNVNATVKRGEDTEYTPTTSVPLIPTLAFVLHSAGFQRDRAIEIITTAMINALNEEGEASQEILSYVADIKKAISHVESITSNLPKQTRKGATTVKGSVTIVAQSQPQAA